MSGFAAMSRKAVGCRAVRRAHAAHVSLTSRMQASSSVKVLMACAISAQDRSKQGMHMSGRLQAVTSACTSMSMLSDTLTVCVSQDKICAAALPALDQRLPPRCELARLDADLIQHQFVTTMLQCCRRYASTADMSPRVICAG